MPNLERQTSPVQIIKSIINNDLDNKENPIKLYAATVIKNVETKFDFIILIKSHTLVKRHMPLYSLKNLKKNIFVTTIIQRL